jgi:hypothetical protein
MQVYVQLKQLQLQNNIIMQPKNKQLFTELFNSSPFSPINSPLPFSFFQAHEEHILVPMERNSLNSSY